jgi:hypothetical protein
MLGASRRVASSHAALLKALAIGVMAVAATGCAADVPSVSVPTASVPVSTASLPPVISAAIEFRSKLGIRADEAFVRELADDPAAVGRGERSGFGVPLTEAELIVLRGRVEDLREIATAGHAYGLRHPEAFAGDYTDQANHRYVFLVTNGVEEHRAGLLAELPFGSPVVVQLADSSLGELDALFERVRRDEAYFGSIGVRYIGLSVLEKDNVVEVTVGADDPSAESQILEHFGTPPKLRVRIVPGAIPQDGYGRVIVQVVDEDGQPASPRNVNCQLVHEDVGGWSPDLWELSPIDTRCRYSRVPAGRIDARIIRDGGDRRLLANKRGVVTAGDEVTITVTFEK